MKALFRLLLLVMVAGLAFWLCAIFFQSPKTVIRKRLNKLAQLASFPANEGGIARALNLQKISGFFPQKIEVIVDAPIVGKYTFDDRDEMMQALFAARSSLKGATVKFQDMNIELPPGGQSAIVDLAFRADVGGEKDAMVLELKFNLKKVDGDWLITRVETVK